MIFVAYYLLVCLQKLTRRSKHPRARIGAEKFQNIFISKKEIEF